MFFGYSVYDIVVSLMQCSASLCTYSYHCGLYTYSYDQKVYVLQCKVNGQELTEFVPSITSIDISIGLMVLKNVRKK